MECFDFFIKDTFYHYQRFLNSLNIEKFPIGSYESKVDACKFASSISSFIEYLFIDNRELVKSKYSVSGQGKFKEALFKRSFSIGEKKVSGKFLKYTFDIANAYKHKKIDRHNPLVSDIEQVCESILIIVNKDSEGSYYAIDKGIKVTDNLGREHNLEIVLRVSFDIIAIIAKEFSVITEIPSVSYSKKFKLSRDESNNTYQFKSTFFEALSGTKVTLSALIQVFDENEIYSLRHRRKNEPVNLKLSFPVKIEVNPLLSL
ncbi:MAG: hypothetical protein GYB16_07975 [Gammaproteobacteria bacterium]|nr:hypothetical protein [Gammaproteobacteria bacterium]